MSTLEVIAVAVTLAGIFVGLAGAAFLVGRRPDFWVGAAIFSFKKAWPYILKYVTARNTPEIEAKMAECIRRGGEWDNFNKKCRFK